MRSILLASGLFILAAGPLVAVAGGGHQHAAHDCCATCTQPRRRCTCTTFTPVVETCYRKEQCVTCQHVKKTVYRRVPQIETVPVTKIDCVTVDEGGYQMVWVPKFVTKQVPRTEYQQRVTCKTVAQEVTCKVPVVQTRLVPEQRIRCVPQTVTCPTQGCVSPPTPGCAAPAYPYVPPVSSLSSEAPAPPAPDPRYLETPAAHGPYEDFSEGISLSPDAAISTAPRRPTAASVWQVRSGIFRR